MAIRKIFGIISGLAILCGPGIAQAATITVYTECNYEGASAKFDTGDYRLDDIIRNGIPNDQISSIKVGDDSQVLIYKHDKFSGRTLTVSRDYRCLKGTGLNNDISSMKVRRYEPPRDNSWDDRGYGSSSFDLIEYDGGRYEKTGNRIWTQYDESGRAIGSYEQLSYRKRKLYLYDERREDLIEIDRDYGTVRIGPFGERNPVRYRFDGRNSD